MAAKQLVLATANTNKVREIRALFPSGYILQTIREVNVTEELPETTGTIEGNALQKARKVFELTGKSCLADDSGLIVPALEGKPGVDSAFFAGLPRSDQRNMEKLLFDLQGKSRAAYFVCVIAVVLQGEDFLFQGELHGSIAQVPTGNNGFGYDPVFIPEGDTRTLAQHSSEEKNRISHRAKALAQLVHFLNTCSPD